MNTTIDFRFPKQVQQEIIEAAKVMSILGSLCYMRRPGRKEVELASSDFRLIYSKRATSPQKIKKAKKNISSIKPLFNLDALIQAPKPFSAAGITRESIKIS